MTFKLSHSFKIIRIIKKILYGFIETPNFDKNFKQQKLLLGGHQTQSSTAAPPWKWTFKPFSQHLLS